MKTVSEHMGAVIKEHRRRLNLSQEHLGSLIGLTRASVINIENGRHRVTVDTVMVLCSLFKCTPNDLFPPVKGKRLKIELGEKIVKRIKKFKTVKLI